MIFITMNWYKSKTWANQIYHNNKLNIQLECRFHSGSIPPFSPSFLFYLYTNMYIYWEILYCKWQFKTMLCLVCDSWKNVHEGLQHIYSKNICPLSYPNGNTLYRNIIQFLCCTRSRMPHRKLHHARQSNTQITRRTQGK